MKEILWKRKASIFIFYKYLLLYENLFLRMFVITLIQYLNLFSRLKYFFCSPVFIVIFFTHIFQCIFSKPDLNRFFELFKKILVRLNFFLWLIIFIVGRAAWNQTKNNPDFEQTAKTAKVWRSDTKLSFVN